MDVHLYPERGSLLMRGKFENNALTVTIEIGCVTFLNEAKYMTETSASRTII
jgi:hypothetical protein